MWKYVSSPNTVGWDTKAAHSLDFVSSWATPGRATKLCCILNCAAYWTIFFSIFINPRFNVLFGKWKIHDISNCMVNRILIFIRLHLELEIWGTFSCIVNRIHAKSEPGKSRVYYCKFLTCNVNLASYLEYKDRYTLEIIRSTFT